MPDPSARLFSDGTGPALVLAPDTKEDAEFARLSEMAEVTTYPAGSGLVGALKVLGNRGINEVLIEPGPRLLTALWESDLIDRFVVVTAGGMAGPDAPALYVGEPERTQDALAPKLHVEEAGIVGDVAVTAWRRSCDLHAQTLEGSPCSPV
jgi:diaminohydroxyphosphoribosylaminopyrimidine deaminase/5-amino-6-(5-phosphoribosylamino)uracil reductase